MAVTIIPTMYRDAANWKWHGEIHLDGEITAQQIDELRTALCDGTHYSPVQLGLEHHGLAESSSFPTDDDHGWQEMSLDEILVEPSSPSGGGWGRAERAGTVAEFIAHVQAAAAAGWNPAIPCSR